MGLRNDLDIYLITFNRCECLEKTLNKLSAVDSPIKDFEIKILDNCSNDGTQKLCKKFTTQHPNFKYIQNEKNLGISGNIIKAMELASKKWLWVLCDDDEYDWSNWGEIEQALCSDEYDIVHTTYSENFRSEEYAYLINEEAFIPTCIYNSKHITSLTMQNAYAMAYTLLPHHAIGCKVINEKGKIFVPQKRCVIQGMDDKFNFIRMPKRGLFHKIDEYQILAGYVSAYKLIEDDNIRSQCCDVLCLGQDFFSSMNWFLDSNPKQNIYNVFEMLLSVDNNKKIRFLRRLSEENHFYPEFNSLCDLILHYYIAPKSPAANYLIAKEHQLMPMVEYLVKVANKPTFLQTIFSVRNENNYKVVRILGIKVKYKRKAKTLVAVERKNLPE